MQNPLNHPSALRTIGLLFLGLVLAGVFAGLVRSFSGTPSSAGVVPSGPLPGELVTPAPWPANNGPQLAARLAALGLPALAAEGTTLHIHAHLDVFVDGRRVVVPAGIGIDRDGTFVSPLHTHDASGIIHVESPTIRTFTLGEFLGVWGMRFRGGCLGGSCAGHGRAVHVYADGRPVTNAAQLPLAAHEEIVVAFGQVPSPVPSSYAFPPGA